MNGRYPSVQRLALHLNREHTVFYRSEHNLRESFKSGRAERTTLTEFFALCNTNIEGLGKKARDCRYQELPKYFWWSDDKRWIPRKRTSEAIGRLYYAPIGEGEKYFFRLLLLHRVGPKSFEDLRTVSNVTYDSYRKAAEAEGLLASDAHYIETLSEASLWMVG
jgi:hypothetical protein